MIYLDVVSGSRVLRSVGLVSAVKPSLSPKIRQLRPVLARSAYGRKRTKLIGLCFLVGGAFAGVLGIPASADAKSPVRSLLEMREQAVITQKSDLSCGAAALATLLNFQFGDRVTEKEVTAGLIRRQEYI